MQSKASFEFLEEQVKNPIQQEQGINTKTAVWIAFQQKFQQRDQPTDQQSD